MTKDEPKEKTNIFGIGAARDAAEKYLPSVRIELISNREAVVDGCRGIIEYSESCIRLGSERQVVKFTGSGLEIRCFLEGGAVVAGEIRTVEFC